MKHESLELLRKLTMARGLAALRVPVVAATLSLAVAQAQAPVDIRVALIIGNGAYSHVTALANPANDARAMSTTLKQLGFEVIELRDASKVQMTEAIVKIRQSLTGKQGVGMLYYAGHGLQLDWHNYMVPVDANPANASEVPVQTIDVGSVIDTFKSAGNRMNILVLDACRDNPFSDTGRGIASGKGLAQLDAPPGTLLAYATAPGNVAQDGDVKGGNGLYTQFLLQELRKPSAKIEDVFKRVRLNVRKQSQGRQIPWESTSLEDDFSFNDGLKPIRQPAKQGSARDKPLNEAAFAREFADESDAWDKIKGSRNANDFYAFLQAYPNGLISEQAQFNLDRLEQARIQIQPDRNGIQILASGANRYVKGDEWAVVATDGFNSAKQQTVVQRVTEIDGDKVVINGGQVILSQMGGVIKNKFGVKSPLQLVVPAEIALGKSWRTTFNNTRPDGVKESNYWDFKVVALEDIQAMGRIVKAFKVEGSGFATWPGGVTTLSATNWIDPSTMLLVRNERLFRSNGRIVVFENTVMTEYRPVTRCKSSDTRNLAITPNAQSCS